MEVSALCGDPPNRHCSWVIEPLRLQRAGCNHGAADGDGGAAGGGEGTDSTAAVTTGGTADGMADGAADGVMDGVQVADRRSRYR